MKLRRNTLSIVSLSLACVLLFCVLSTPTIAVWESNVLDVTSIVQQEEHWCWAACAEIVGRYICGYPFLGIGYRSQADIVSYIKGSNINETAPIAETTRACQYAAKDTRSFAYQMMAWRWEALRDHIDKGKVVVLSAGYYQNNIRKGGHLVVLTGWAMSEATNTYCIYYIDPGDGNRRFCEYSAFCDGTFNKRIYDRTVYYF